MTMGPETPPLVSQSFQDVELGDKLTIPSEAIIRLLSSHKTLRESARKLKNNNYELRKNLDRVELLLKKFKDYCKKYSKCKDIDSIFEHATKVTNKTLRDSGGKTEEAEVASIAEVLEEYIWLVEVREKNKEYQAQEEMLEFSDIDSDLEKSNGPGFFDVESQHGKSVDRSAKADSVIKTKSEEPHMKPGSRANTPGLVREDGELQQEGKPTPDHGSSESIFKQEQPFERQPRNYILQREEVTDYKTEIPVKVPELSQKNQDKPEYSQESDKSPESPDEDPHKAQLNAEGIRNLDSFLNRNVDQSAPYPYMNYNRQHPIRNKRTKGGKHKKGDTPREIYLSHLPQYISAQEISSMIRGGPVLHLSVIREGGFSNARIIFAYGWSATEYLDWFHRAPVTLHSEAFCVQPKAAPETDQDVLNAMSQKNARRVLIFELFTSDVDEINPDTAWNLLTAHLGLESSAIESIGLIPEQTGFKVILRSVGEAIYVKDLLRKLGYDTKFGRDETEGKTDELPINRNFGEWFEKEMVFSNDSK